MPAVELYEDNAGQVYVKRDGSPLWNLGQVTADMHGQFNADAYAWLAGTWTPDGDGAANNAGNNPGKLELDHVATCTPGVGDIWHRDRYENPVAWLYMRGPLCTSCGEPTTSGLEVNAEPTCPRCLDELQADTDKDALNRIAALIAAPDYSPLPALTGIIAIVRGTGRSVDADPDDTDCGLLDEQAASGDKN